MQLQDSTSHLLTEVTSPTGISVNKLCKWITKNKSLLNKKLQKNGGLVFRNFKISDPEEFQNIALSIDCNLMDRHIFDGAVTLKRTKFVSEVASPDIEKVLLPLSLHNEDVFTSQIPDKIMFCSLESAPRGGESLIADCRRIYNSLPKIIQQKYKNQKLKSTINLEDKLLLANSLTPKNFKSIKSLVQEFGATDVKRITENTTQMTFIIPATITNNLEENIWLNTLHQSTCYNDLCDIWMSNRNEYSFYGKSTAFYLSIGTLIKHLMSYFQNKHTMKMHNFSLLNGKKIKFWERFQINMAFWNNTRVLPLKDGDFYVLNNRLTAHGRMPYKGRRVMLSAITKPSSTL